MKSRFIAKLNAVIILSVSVAFGSIYMPVKAADVVGIDGGIMNANYYEEYVFVDGTPELFTGTAKVTTTTSNSKTTTKITYSLTGPGAKSSLKRTVSYDAVVSDQTADYSNETSTETIVLNGVTYTLASQGGYQLSKADTVSNNAGLNFQSGEWNCIKTYNVTGNQTGTLTINEKGSEATTDNYWGDSHFQGLKYDINYVPTASTATSTTGTTTNNTTKITPQVSWTGHVEVRLSAQRVGKLTYTNSLPVTTAIRGAYTRTDQKNVTAIYKYDLPADTTSATSSKRLKSTATINLRDNPDIKKYVVKNLKDINSKDGDNAIQRMTSLDILTSGQYFFQSLTITRADFLKALMRACNIWSDKTTTTKYQFGNQTSSTALFLDVDSKNPYYAYIKDAITNGIIDGQPGDFFRPDDPITKSEAATMITRAIGLHDSPYVDGPNIKFKDEQSVPSSSKDDLYTLAKLGILKTDSRGNIYPISKVTRGTAADMLNSLLNYLQTDLQKDYDSLIQFN